MLITLIQKQLIFFQRIVLPKRNSFTIMLCPRLIKKKISFLFNVLLVTCKWCSNRIKLRHHCASNWDHVDSGPAAAVLVGGAVMACVQHLVFKLRGSRKFTWNSMHMAGIKSKLLKIRAILLLRREDYES